MIFGITLRQDCSYGEVRHICFQDYWFGRVEVGQYWGHGESLFLFHKGSLHFLVPFPFLPYLFLCYLGECPRHPRIILDELLGKIRKAQKGLVFCDRACRFPANHSFYLPFGYFDPILPYNISQKFHFLSSPYTFFWGDCQPIVLPSCYYFLD